MLDRGILYQAEKHNDPAFPFRKIKDHLSEADILFGNLESVISDKGFNQGGPYSFRAPPEMMEGLLLAGFDIMSIANNHSFDWTVEALVDTKRSLIKNKIMPVGGGGDAYSPVLIEEKDQTVAFIGHTAMGAPGWAVTKTTPGVAWYDEKRLEKAIEEAKNKADITVFSIHYGNEYQSQPSQNQINISKNAIDMGVDLVIGHHPHVIQPVEEYGGGLIAYSLGNFIFDQSFSKGTMEGLLLTVDIKEGEIKGYKKEVIQINNQLQPESFK